MESEKSAPEEQAVQQSTNPTIKKMPGAWNLLKQSFVLYKQNFVYLFKKVFGPFALLFIVIPILFGIILMSSPDIGKFGIMLFVVFIVTFYIFTYTLYIISTYKVSYLITENQPLLETRELLEQSLQKFWPFIGLIIMVQLTVIGGFVFLIIPAIFLSIYASYYYYAQIIDDKKGVEAIAYVLSIAKKRFFNITVKTIVLVITFFLVQIILAAIFLLTSTLIVQGSTDMSFIEAFKLNFLEEKAGFPQTAINVVNTVSLIQGLLGQIIYFFVLTPIATFYGYLIYKSLKENAFEIPNKEKIETRKNIIKVFMGVGLIAIMGTTGLLYHYYSKVKGEDFIPTVEVSQYNVLEPQLGFNSYEDYLENAPEKLQKEDSALVAKTLAQFDGNKKETSIAVIDFYFNELEEVTFESSMEGINIAWLIDQDNYFVYAMFGQLFIYSDPEKALAWFEKSISLYDEDYVAGFPKKELFCYRDATKILISEDEEFINSTVDTYAVPSSSFECLRVISDNLYQIGRNDQAEYFDKVMEDNYPDAYYMLLESEE